MSPPRRALALVLAALLVPLAAAQTIDPTEGPPAAPLPEERIEDTETPEELDCTQVDDPCFPDLIPSNPRANATDERFPLSACTDFINVGDSPAATPFRVRVEIDGVAAGEKQFSRAYQRGEGEANVCFDNLHIVNGRHRLTVLVDAENEMPESNERNNARSVNFTVRPTPQVDLRLTSFKVLPKDGAPRQNQFFAVNVTNVGTAASVATTIEISDPNGIIATLPLPALMPRESRSVAHATRPEYRPVGTFIARAVVDPQNNNSEIVELDNDAYVEYTVLDHPASDLTITNITFAGNRTEFRGLRAFVTVQNVGDRHIRGNLVHAFNETGARVADGYSVGTIYPNQTSTVQLNLVLRAGQRVITFVVDPQREALEKNESNNVWIENVEITVPATIVDDPNLVIERMYAMPSDPRPGETVSVGALIRNIGTNRSNATVVNFTVDGKSLGSAPVPVLAPDTSYSAYVPWIATTAGLFDLVALADGTGKVTELDESDNTFGLSFLVTTTAQTDPEEPAEPEPEEPTPPIPTTPTPTTPTAPTPPRTNTTTPGANGTAPRIAFGELAITTKPVPGGLKGTISVMLRNPTITPIGRLEVTFKVDGEELVTVLVGGIRAAATETPTSGEVDLPEGKHTVSAEVRIVGTTSPPVAREKEYEAVAGEKTGVPGPAVGILVLALAAIALARRR